MFFFNKTTKRDAPDYSDDENEILDVDSIIPRKTGITATTPKSSENWYKKLDQEDAHIRNIK